MKLIPHRPTGQQKSCLIFLVCNDLVPLSQPAPEQCFTLRQIIAARCASTHFGENQLAPNSIEISSLTTTHPTIFQHRWVRPSMKCYLQFSLAMVRSSGFGSENTDYLRPIQTRFRSGYGLSSLTSQCLRVAGSFFQRHAVTFKNAPTACQLYDFIIYFTPCQGFSFTFPSRYLFTIDHSGVFSLTRWSSWIHTGFHVSHATRDKKTHGSLFR